MCLELLQNPEWLRDQYVNNGLTIQDIADHLESNYAVVRKCLIKLNIPVRNSHHSQRIKLNLPAELEHKSWLWEKYVNQKMSFNEIARELKVKFANVTHKKA